MRVSPLAYSHIGLADRFRPNEIARSITLRYAGRCSLMLKYRFATFAGLLSLSRPRSSLHLAL